MAFELPPLPYDTNALAACGMCQETLELHHGKHHQAYVTALNGFVEKGAGALQGKSLDEIVKQTASTPGPVFNNAGQHWNHILFWKNLSPTGGKIPGKLAGEDRQRSGRHREVQGSVQAGGDHPVRVRLGVARSLGTDGKLKR